MNQDQSTRSELIEKLDAFRREEENPESLSIQTGRRKDDLHPFFAQSLDLLCIAGFDGYFKRLSQTWTALFGWTLEELESKPFLDFIHPDDREAAWAEADRLIKGGETIFFENRYRIKDGSYR